MLDLDLQTDLIDINLSQKDDSKFFYLFKGRKTIEKVIVELPGKGDKKIIPGSVVVDEIQRKVTTSLAEIVEELKLTHDFVLLDHPPSITEISEAGYIASDELVIVAVAQQLSLKNLVSFLVEVEIIKRTEATELEVLGIVANKVDLRRKLTERMLEEYRRTYPNLFFENYIGVDTAIPNVQIGQQNIRDLDWRARTLNQIERVIEEILQRLQ